MIVLEELKALSDKTYKDFQANLIPTIDKDSILGVRVPNLRKLAKQILKNDKEVVDVFLNSLPHNYYDENMLHSILISELKSHEEVIKHLNRFLPYVDNWCVCDIINPKVFKKLTSKSDTEEVVFKEIEAWINSDHTYTQRFGIEMLMTYYLDELFNENQLNMVIGVDNDDYYIEMMKAWYIATALYKKWDSVIGVLEDKKLEKSVHNKAIQKAIESKRITLEQKEYLRLLKVK